MERVKISGDDGSCRIALVLGGGGARGLAHILVLEAFDELGLKPSLIAGTSIGAIIGASYASGLCAEEIREHCVRILGNRVDIFKQLFVQRPDTLRDLWNFGAPRRSLMKPEALLEIIFPDKVVRDFSDLLIPLKVVATDYYGQEMVVLDEGELIHAVAASMALPTIFRPVTIDGTVLIDGGFTNPLPFDIVGDAADLTMAIDVTGGPQKKEGKDLPSGVDVLFAASQIMQNSIVKEKLKTTRPDILIRPPVDHVPVLAVHKIKEILEETKALKDDVKRALEKALSGKTSASI